MKEDKEIICVQDRKRTFNPIDFGSLTEPSGERDLWATVLQHAVECSAAVEPTKGRKKILKEGEIPEWLKIRDKARRFIDGDEMFPWICNVLDMDSVKLRIGIKSRWEVDNVTTEG